MKPPPPPARSSLLKTCLVTRCSFHGSVYRSDAGANLILGLGEGEWEMRSLMRENESETAKSAARGGRGARSWIKGAIANNFKWCEWSVEVGDAESEGRMRSTVVYANRGCPQDLLPSSFIYSRLFIYTSLCGINNRLATPVAVYIYFFPQTYWGFPICAKRWTVRSINLLFSLPLLRLELLCCTLHRV